MMTSNQIRRKHNSITKRLNKATEDMRQLQKDCPHVNVKQEYKSDTGNYDPGMDMYWIEFRCEDCQAFRVEVKNK